VINNKILTENIKQNESQKQLQNQLKIIL